MMKKILMTVIILVFLTLSITLLGCDGGTELDVEAPPGVEIKSASIKDDGTLSCRFATSKSGNLQFSLPYTAVMTPENNPNIISGQVSRSGSLSFSMEVEAEQDYDIDPQFNLPAGDLSWETLVLEFE